MTRNHPIQDSEQRILNKALDNDFDALVVSNGVFDGKDLQRAIDPKLMNQVIITAGQITYICIAPAGTARSEEKWQCKKIDESTVNEVTITWANGNTNFDSSSTDPSSLTYS